MENLSLNRRFKIRLIVGSVITLLLLAVVIFAILQQQQNSQVGKIAVPTRILPSDAVVTTESEELKTKNSNYLTSGNHTITIKKEGFETTTVDLKVNENNFAALYVGLIPKSDEAKRWHARHESDYRKLEKLQAKQAREYGLAFKERNPIVEILPIDDPYFTIGYKNLEDKDVMLTIYGTSPRYREFAIGELYRRGFDPTNYKIEYRDFDNPLESGETDNAK